MNLQDASYALDAKLLHWALGFSRSEVLGGFTHISRLPSADAISYVELLREHPPVKQLAIASMMVRYFHRSRAPHSDVALSGAEEFTCRALLEEIRRRSEAKMLNGPIEPELLRGARKRRILRLLQERLEKGLGARPEWRTRDNLLFTRRIGPWILETDVGVGGSLWYFHGIRHESGPVLRRYLSILFLAGISPQVQFDYYAEHDEESVVAQIQLLCDIFLPSCAGWLADIALDRVPATPDTPDVRHEAGPRLVKKK